MAPTVDRRGLLSGLVAGGLLPAAAQARAAPPAVWPPKGKHPLTGRTQFVLLDMPVRFLPNSPATNPGPHAKVPLPKGGYPDDGINHHNDGFKIAFIDRKVVPSDLPDDWYGLHYEVPADIPASWRAPVDFYGGTVHYRIDVVAKPDDTTLTSLIARVTTEVHEGTHNVWFGHGVCTFDRKGLHHFEQPVRAFRPFIRDTKFDFGKRLAELQLCVADSRGAVVHRWVEQPHNAFQGTPNLGLYLPLEVRYTAVVVAAGAKLAAPAWW
jgi:hypothetical protein